MVMVCEYLEMVLRWFWAVMLSNYLKHVEYCDDLGLVADNTTAFQDALLEMTGQQTVPNIFVNGQHLGKHTPLN